MLDENSWVRNDSSLFSLKERLLKWQSDSNNKTCAVMQPKLISQFRQNYVPLNYFLTEKDKEKIFHYPRWLFELYSQFYFCGFAVVIYDIDYCSQFWWSSKPRFRYQIKFIGLSIGSLKNAVTQGGEKCLRMTMRQCMTVYWWGRGIFYWMW